MKQHNPKPWVVTVISIVLTLLVGGLSALLSQGSMSMYDAIPKSGLTPPDIVFPIVWSILYILMGIGVARIYLAGAHGAPGARSALWIYGIQLAVNFFWSIFFFVCRVYLFSFLWLLLLWVLVLWMIIRFASIDRPAGYLQIPYLIWISFAAYLNWVVFSLNS